MIGFCTWPDRLDRNAALTREFLNWEYPPFEIPNEVYAHFRKSINKGENLEKEWDSKFEEYQKKYPSEGSELKRMLKGKIGTKIYPHIHLMIKV